jgi:polar amino acid transport system substrate-binding protein
MDKQQQEEERMSSMKKYLFSASVVFVLSFAVFLSTSFGGEFNILTDSYAPYNFTEGDKITGLSSEIMVELLNRVGHPNNIQMAPWSDAYEKISNSDGYVLYSMTRTEERENMFKWVGPLATEQWVFFAKQGSGVKIESLDDAHKVGTIGTCKDYATEQFLKKEGFTNLVSVNDDGENLKKLVSGEIDLWVVADLQGIHQAKEAGIDPSTLENVLKIQETELFIAFSKNTPDDVIAKWQKALDDIKAEGLYDKILSKYM